MPGHRVFATPFSRIYPMYVQKAERKQRTKDEVDQVIRWLTGYTQDVLEAQVHGTDTLEEFFARAPAFQPRAALIKAWCAGCAWKKSRIR